jgi:hypothetical protein
LLNLLNILKLGKLFELAKLAKLLKRSIEYKLLILNFTDEEGHHKIGVMFFEVGRFLTSHKPAYLKLYENRYLRFSQEVIDRSGVNDASCSEYKDKKYKVNLRLGKKRLG